MACSGLLSSSAPQAVLADQSALNNCIKYLWTDSQAQQQKLTLKKKGKEGLTEKSFSAVKWWCYLSTNVGIFNSC